MKMNQVVIGSLNVSLALSLLACSQNRTSSPAVPTPAVKAAAPGPSIAGYYQVTSIKTNGNVTQADANGVLPDEDGKPSYQQIEIVTDSTVEMINHSPSKQLPDQDDGKQNYKRDGNKITIVDQSGAVLTSAVVAIAGNQLTWTYNDKEGTVVTEVAMDPKTAIDIQTAIAVSTPDPAALTMMDKIAPALPSAPAYSAPGASSAAASAQVASLVGSYEVVAVQDQSGSYSLNSKGVLADSSGGSYSQWEIITDSTIETITYSPASKQANSDVKYSYKRDGNTVTLFNAAGTSVEKLTVAKTSGQIVWTTTDGNVTTEMSVDPQLLGDIRAAAAKLNASIAAGK